MGECSLEGAEEEGEGDGGEAGGWKGGGGVQERLLRLQVKIMCRSGEICRQHFYSFFDYLPSLSAALSVCLFVCLFLALVLRLSAQARAHARMLMRAGIF